MPGTGADDTKVVFIVRSPLTPASRGRDELSFQWFYPKPMQPVAEVIARAASY